MHELAQCKIAKQAALTLGAQQVARLDTFEKDLAFYQVGLTGPWECTRHDGPLIQTDDLNRYRFNPLPTSLNHSLRSSSSPSLSPRGTMRCLRATS